jgi:hypothetical protein
MCNEYRTSGRHLLEPEVAFGKKIRLVYLKDLPYGGQVAELFVLSDISPTVPGVNYLEIGSTKFHFGDALLCPLNGPIPSQFGKIVESLVSTIKQFK